MSNTQKSLILVLLILFVAVGLSEAAVKRYGVKSGYIKYENSNGTSELYWDGFGEKEARYTDSTVTVFGMTKNSQTVNFTDGEWTYDYDPSTNIATRYNQDELMKRMTGNHPPKEFSEEMIKAFGGEKVGNETVLNKNTDIYVLNKMGGYKVWVYKGVPLKSEFSMMGMDFTSQAVEFKENTSIDSQRLALPVRAQIVEGDLEKLPTSEELQNAGNRMHEMQDDPEYTEAMQKMKELQNDPEFSNAMKQMQGLQNSPQYNNAMKQSQDLQKYKKTVDPTEDTDAITNKAGNIIKEETDAAVEDAIRGTTRDGLKKALGGGLKSIFNN